MEVKYLNLEYFFNKFFEFFKTLPEKISGLGFGNIFNKWESIYIYISLAFLFGIIFLSFKIAHLRKKKIKSYIDIFLEKGLPEERSTRWEEIKSHMDSENLAEWKIAIIEADSVMDDILKRIGYEGDSLGERLKNIEPSDFDNLQNVWEAHKVRNRIVHEGEKLVLSKDEAKQIIEFYEKALKEFRYI